MESVYGLVQGNYDFSTEPGTPALEKAYVYTLYLMYQSQGNPRISYDDFFAAIERGEMPLQVFADGNLVRNLRDAELWITPNAAPADADGEILTVCQDGGFLVMKQANALYRGWFLTNHTVGAFENLYRENIGSVPETFHFDIERAAMVDAGNGYRTPIGSLRNAEGIDSY